MEEDHGTIVERQLPTMDMSKPETGCCPRFEPDLWDGKTFDLSGYRFVRVLSRSFLYMPLNLGTVLARTAEAVEKAGAMPKDRYLILSRDLSPWRCEHFYLVEKDVEGLQTAGISASFLAKVYEGPYKDLPKWMKDMKHATGLSGPVYAFYTTCPNCAKVYGKNYVVLLAATGR